MPYLGTISQASWRSTLNTNRARTFTCDIRHRLSGAGKQGTLHRIANGRISERKGTKIGTKSVARAVRARLVTLFNWHVANHGSEDFRSPILRPQMNDPGLQTPAPRNRDLTDGEIAALWTACGDLGT